MLPKDITAGESWACRFRTHALVTESGDLFDSTGTQPGTSVAAEPGVYESIGVIVRRDSEQELLELRDTVSHKHIVVGFADVWDIDRVEWVE